MKKILSAILVVAIMLTVVSSMAFAAQITDAFTSTNDYAQDKVAWRNGTDATATRESASKFTVKTNSAISSQSNKGINITFDRTYNLGEENVFLYFTAKIEENVADNNTYLYWYPDGISSGSEITRYSLKSGSYTVKIYYDIKNKKMIMSSAASGMGDMNGAKYDMINSDNKFNKIDTKFNKAITCDANVDIIKITSLKSKEYTPKSADYTLEDFVFFCENGYIEEEDTPTFNLPVEAVTYSGYDSTVTKNGDNTITISAGTEGKYGFQFYATEYNTEKRYVVLSADFESTYSTSYGIFRRGGKNFGTSKCGSGGPLAFTGLNSDKNYNVKCLVDTVTNDVYYYIDGVLKFGFVADNDGNNDSSASDSTLGYALTSATANASLAQGATAVTIKNITITGYDATATPAEMGISGAYLKDGKVHCMFGSLKKYNSGSSTLSKHDLNNTISIVAGFDSEDNLVIAKYATESGVNFDKTGVATIKVYTWDATTLEPYHFVTGIAQ